MLHLDECELPCWIGIVPGQTSLVDAQNQIIRVYGNTSEYRLQKRSDYEFEVTYAVTGESFLIAFIPDTPITQLLLLPYTEELSGKRSPTISDLYDHLGNPAMVNLVSDFPVGEKVNLVYQDQRIQLRVPDLECDKVLVTQEIQSIALYAGLPTYGYGWLSDSKQWRGFGRCYDLEPKLTPLGS